MLLRSFRFIYRLFLGLALGMVLFAILLLSVGFVYKKEVERYVLQELGKNLNGRVVVGSVELNLLYSWPMATITVHNVQVYLNDEDSKAYRMQGQPLIKLENLVLKVSIRDVMNKQYRIRRLAVQRPVIRLATDAKGRWNYSCLLPPEQKKQDTTHSSLALHLQQLVLHEAHLIIDDPKEGQFYDTHLKELSLSGSFVRSQLSLQLELQADLNRLVVGHLPLLHHRPLWLKGSLRADDKGRVRVNTDLRLASIPIHLHGTWQGGILPAIDLHLSTGTAPFAQFLSVMPPRYQQVVMRDITATGNFSLQGRYHGPMDKALLELTAQVHNGTLTPKAYKQAALRNLKLEAELMLHADPAQSYLNITHLQAHIGQKPLEGHFYYQNFAHPRLDVALKANARLRELTIFYPDLASLPVLEGRVELQLAGKGELKSWQTFPLNAELKLEQASLQTRGMRQPIHDLTGSLRWQRGELELQQLSGRVGASDFDLRGHTHRLTDWLRGKAKEMEVLANLKAEHLEADELTALFVTEEQKKPATGTAKTETGDHGLGIRWRLNTDARSVKYENLRVKDLRANLLWAEPVMRLEQLSCTTLGGSIQGSLTKVHNALEGNLDLQNMDMEAFFAAFPDLKEWMVVGPYIQGRISTKLTAKAGLDKDNSLISKSLYVKGDVAIKQMKLLNFKPVEEMNRVVQKRFTNMVFDDFATTFTIDNERFSIDSTDLYINGMHLQVYGSHDFATHLNYYVAMQVKGLLQMGKPPKTTKPQTGSVDDLIAIEETPAEAAPDDPTAGMHLLLHITGTADDPNIKLDKQRIKQQIKEDLRQKGQDLKQMLSLGKRRRKAHQPMQG